METSSHAAGRRSATVVRWEFIRGHERVSCRVARAGNGHDGHGFAVELIPYEHVRSATRELFRRVEEALQRHAALALDLRSTGWKLVAYTT
jgi:hypothetical protein